MFVLLHPLLTGKSAQKTKELPHSSSGPGHLPLTQKIISSTLICGTKATEKSVAFFFIELADKNKYASGICPPDAYLYNG